MLVHNSFQLGMCCSDIKALLLCCVTVSLRSNRPPCHNVTAKGVRASHTDGTCFWHWNFESTTDEQQWATLKWILLVSISIKPMLLFLSEEGTEKKQRWRSTRNEKHPYSGEKSSLCFSLEFKTLYLHSIGGGELKEIHAEKETCQMCHSIDTSITVGNGSNTACDNTVSQLTLKHMRQLIRSSAVPITPTETLDCRGQDAQQKSVYEQLLPGLFSPAMNSQVWLWFCLSSLGWFMSPAELCHVTSDCNRCQILDSEDCTLCPH